MGGERAVEMEVEGPVVDRRDGTHTYAVRSPEGDVSFTVLPETSGEQSGWGVSIEGLPDPGIVHAQPWPTVETARDAALNAIHHMLILRRMQREEAERYRPKDPEEQEPESEI
jgi:hypothetical protein